MALDSWVAERWGRRRREAVRPGLGTTTAAMEIGSGGSDRIRWARLGIDGREERARAPWMQTAESVVTDWQVGAQIGLGWVHKGAEMPAIRPREWQRQSCGVN